MKKIIVSFFVLLVLFSGFSLANAQAIGSASSTCTTYNSCIQLLINLLIARVQQLEQQLALIQSQNSTSTTSSTVSTDITTSTGSATPTTTDSLNIVQNQVNTFTAPSNNDTGTVYPVPPVTTQLFVSVDPSQLSPINALKDTRSLVGKFNVYASSTNKDANIVLSVKVAQFLDTMLAVNETSGELTKSEHGFSPSSLNAQYLGGLALANHQTTTIDIYTSRIMSTGVLGDGSLAYPTGTYSMLSLCAPASPPLNTWIDNINEFDQSGNRMDVQNGACILAQPVTVK